ncbi:hypothetical protein HYR99_02485 [Candidatus Poribacteria bacterium]|nr:hypothetical protein [Candidatus Poribacteria bacterium]
MTAINTLGVGEYQLRALVTDKAGNPTVTVVTGGAAWQVSDTDSTGGTTLYTVTYNGIRFKVDQAADDYQSVDASGTLQPWEGYGMKTNVDDVTLTIPAPSGLETNINQLPPSYLPPLAPPLAGGVVEKGFALRLALTSAFASDLITELGTRPTAEIGRDAYDTAEPPTLGQTVSVYFDHPEWGDRAGQYNTDYQPLLDVGETRTWRLTVFTDRPNAEMTLSWASVLRQVPDDILLSIRRLDDANAQSSQSANGQIDQTQYATRNTTWLDMRQVQSMKLAATGRITEIPFEIRAERFAMSPPADVQAIAGEKQVELRWKADDNPFIDGYSIERQKVGDEASRFTFHGAPLSTPMWRKKPPTRTNSSFAF